MTKIITGGEFENLAQEIAKQAIEEKIFDNKDDRKTLSLKAHQFVEAKVAKFLEENKEVKIEKLDNFKADVLKEILFGEINSKAKIAEEKLQKEAAARVEYQKTLDEALAKFEAEKAKIRGE